MNNLSIPKPDYIKQWERSAKNMVPESSLPFGDLQIVEVYFYHDGPKLFSLYSKTKDTYLISVAVDEEEEFSTFLYLPLTPKDFDSVVNGRKDFHDAFKMSKSGTVWVVSYDYSADEDSPIIEEKAVNWI